MKKRIYLFSIIVVVLLIAISTLTIVLVNKDTSEKEAEEITKAKFEDEFLDWNKINITMKEKSPNNYYFENMDLHNSDIFLLHGEVQGLKLKEGDNVSVDLTIIPDGLSHTVVGYILGGKFTEIFSAPVSDKLTTSFDVKVDGDYIICIIGGNANFITITDGVISIDYI
ncbi:hypothetical protein ACIQYS_21385 [Psychrobacillus sp. NPDC096426]|uniref:hypothetical protein n=1 Tax=Psychrobacillus sp. NPDC096426 TaxID=3364491 RepID=UPI0038155A22